MSSYYIKLISKINRCTSCHMRLILFNFCDIDSNIAIQHYYRHSYCVSAGLKLSVS